MSKRLRRKVNEGMSVDVTEMKRWDRVTGASGAEQTRKVYV